MSHATANVSEILQKAEDQCSANGTRLTQKRKNILAGLIEANKALSAYELIDICRKEFGENIPAMSMYRILDFLQEELLVHRLNLTNKYVACSHISCDHKHEFSQFLICNRCESVQEVHVKQETVNALVSDIHSSGFHLESPHLEVTGVCETCKSKEMTGNASPDNPI